MRRLFNKQTFSRVGKLFAIPVGAALLSCILFFLVALIPQSAIQENASRAAAELLAQPQHPSVLNVGELQYTMDNYTDCQILLQSYNLTISEPDSILSNPKHLSPRDSSNMAMALDEVVNQGAQNEINYVRYWMGFRIFIRPLLLLDSYYGIRRIVSSVFFMLFLAATLTLAQKVDRKTAVCFGVAVTLVNPAIISQSLQFTCVFILSFLFIIALCHLKDRIPLPYLFCAFGALTQLFDFYTAPVLTFGLPMLVWLMRKPDAKKPLITVFQLLLAWGFGYVSMWLVKLALVTVFTDINGFTDGLHRLAQRTGFAEMEEPTENYTPIMALRAVWTTAFPYPWGKPALLVIAAALALSAVIFWKKGGWSCLWSKASFGLIAAVPVIWFLCSAQPTCIHAWFQYRSLAATFFAVALFVASAGELAFAKKIPQVNEQNQ